MAERTTTGGAPGGNGAASSANGGGTNGGPGGGPRGPGGPGGGPRGNRFQKPRNLRKTLLRLLQYLGGYKALLALVAVLLLFSSLCNVGGSYLLKPLINDYILPGDFGGLARMLAFMGCVYAVGAACSYGYARIMVQVSQNTVAKIREDLFRKMQSLPLRFFDAHTHGELMSRYTNDIETISEALNNSFGNFISSSLNFTFTIIAMLLLNPLLTLVTFGMLEPPLFRGPAGGAGRGQRLHRGDDRGPEGH